MPWLTPDFDDWELICYRVLLPDNDQLRAAFRGAFLKLTRSENWEQYGDATPDQVADAFASCLDFTYAHNECSTGGGAMRIGTFFWWAGETPPDGSLLCDGAEYDPATYPDLFTAIGYVWGQNGTNFKVPDLLNFGVVGAGSGYDVAESVGQGTQTLTQQNLPNMTVPIYRQTGTGVTKYVLQSGRTDGTTENSAPFGSGQAFSVQNPDKGMLPCIEAYTP